MSHHSLPPLNLPQVPLRIENMDGNLKVFDILRKKYVALTPEEYVRQTFVNYLISHFNYPKSLMANEISIKVNGSSKRCDTVVYNKELKPLLIVEYKAPTVEINQSVFDQIVRYNMELRAKYLVVSNGLRHYCCLIDYLNDTYHFLPVIPDYLEATKPFNDN